MFGGHLFLYPRVPNAFSERRRKNFQFYIKINMP